MSLLLDALRKSEKRRKGGSPPPLGLPTGPGAGEPARNRASSGRRRGLMLLLVVSLMAVVTAAWWSAGRPGLDRVTAWLAPSSPERASDAEAGTSDGEPEQRLVADAYRRPEARAAHAGPSETANPVAEPPAGNRADGQERRLDVPKDPTANDAAGEAAGSQAGSRAVVEPAAPDVMQQAAESRAIEPSATEQPTRSAESNGGPRNDPPPVRAAAQPERPDPTREVPPAIEPTARRDNTVAPWDLPAALRADFPSIDVAVHFYADNPADRFVLIEGERYGEGDAINGGVELAEIRRSGIVVEYRSYRIRIE